MQMQTVLEFLKKKWILDYSAHKMLCCAVLGSKEVIDMSSICILMVSVVDGQIFQVPLQ